MLTTIIIFFLAAMAAVFVSQFLSDRKDKRDTKPTLIMNPQDWADRCFVMCVSRYQRRLSFHKRIGS